MIGDDSTTVSPSPTSTGNVPSLVHPCDRVARVVGRIEQRDERAVVDGEQRVHRDERVAHGDVARRVERQTSRSSSRPSTDDLEEHARSCRPSSARPAATASTRLALPADPAHELTARRAQLLDGVGAGEAAGRRSRSAAATGKQRDVGDVELVLDRLVPRHEALAVDVELVDRRRSPTSGSCASIVRRCTWRQRTRTVSFGSAPGSTMHSVRQRRSAPSRSPRRRRAARARRTASASGSSCADAR